MVNSEKKNSCFVQQQQNIYSNSRVVRKKNSEGNKKNIIPTPAS